MIRVCFVRSGLALLAPIFLFTSPVPAGAEIPPPGIDAEIAALVDSISADSLESTILTLQGFFTRHLNADTLSDSVGIGAARRWVHGRFEEISAANGGNLQVGYHEFTATESGITRVHRNVVAALPGSDSAAAERIYVVSGHLDSRNGDINDSTGYAPGANDDGSGIAAAIELARVMAKTAFEATVRFIAFSGEEEGLLGSGAYADEAAAAGEKIEGALNNDMIGNVVYGEVGVGDSLDLDSTHVRMFSEGPSGSSSRQMARSVKMYGASYVPFMTVNLIPAQDRPGRGGDHISFNDAGYTAIRLVDTFDNMIHQHSDGDTAGAMNFPYFARNVGIDLSVLGNLARAPRPVEDFVTGNTGDSTGFVATWSANPEGDLAGYRLTTRFPGVLDYDTALDLGDLLTYTIASAPAESLFVGLAAYDTSGHLGIATEVLAVLSSIPFAPTGLVASPDTAKIRLVWDAAPEGDFSHHNVYRATEPDGPYAQLNAEPLIVPLYDDGDVVPGVFYYYEVSTVDTFGNEGPRSGSVRGRLVSLDQGILFVDETVAGPGQPHRPTEAVSDSFYAAVLESVPHVVFDYDSAAAAGGITLSDLGAYGTVIWVSDDRNMVIGGAPVINQFLPDNTGSLARYMDLGGNVFLMGWKTAGGFDDNYPVAFGPGDFLYDYFRVGTVGSTESGKFFYGATGVGGYPTVLVDTSKTRNAWDGKLPDAEYLTSVASGGETVYTFLSSEPDSAFHGAAVALRYDGGAFRSHCFGFPLYHLRGEDARGLIDEALAYLGGPSTGVAGGEGASSSGALRLEIRSFPNPARGAGVTIRYFLPAMERVDLGVYAVSGRRIRLLEAGRRPPGARAVAWDGRDDRGEEVASGVYLCRLAAGRKHATGKIVLVH